MSKGLEALKGLKSKAIKSISGGMQTLQEKSINREYETIEKELKAFEILKPYINKIVGMNVYDKDFYECFLQIGKERVFIPKEKYDLLKEVLK